MRKIAIILLSLFTIVSLVACDEGESGEKEIGSVNSSEKGEKDESEGNNDDEAEGDSGETKEVNKVIADDDYIKATLISVEHKIDDVFDEEKYVINIELENKTEDKIIVQARDVSIDGTMVDDMVFFSEEIAGDKKANGKIEIQNYEGDLPTMDDNIEFILLIADDETFEDLAEHEVKVEF